MGITNGFEGIAHVEDGFGNILFWVNANGVYDRNGLLMPGSIGLLADPSSTEINVCPFPNDTTKYYIFYNMQVCSPLYYSVVDMTLRSGDGDVSQLNVLLDGGSYAEGMEVIRIPCTNNFWYVTYECGTGFKRFLIDSSGISTGVLIHNYIQPWGYDGRGELDYHNGKMGLAFAWTNRIVTVDFDPSNGTISNPLDIVLSGSNFDFDGIYGLEFSPDASKVYFALWYNLFNNNLFQYDFNTQNLTSYYAGSGGWGLGQIEMGPDEKLYLIHDGGYQITVIDDPNGLNPAFSLINVNSELALGISDHIQSDLVGNKSNFNYTLTCSDSVQFIAYNIGSSCASAWLWDFGDGDTSSLQSPLHAYDSSGSYTVTLLAFHSTATDTIIKDINVGSIRIPDFDYTTVCLGTATLFTDTIPCNPVSWQWNFGDGSPIDTSINPSHLYNSAGDYTVTLIATWSDGYQDSIIKIVSVLADTGNANFYYNALCSDWIQFYDSSLGEPTGWFWDFGDSLGTDTVQYPQYWFSDYGTFNVTLIVTYSNGCLPDTVSKPVVIIPKLTVSFPNVACVGDTIYVSITFAGDTASVSYTYFDFGDGYWVDSFNYIQNAAHVYDSAGTYPVWFEIYYGGWWCYDYVSDSITVYPSPLAYFIVDEDSICTGDSVAFTDSSSGNITSWIWDFGDGSPLDSSQNPIHFYNSDGLYSVTLWITNDVGCFDTLTKYINVLPGFTLFINSPNVTCSGLCDGSATAIALGGVAPYTYFWSNGQTTQTATGLCAGNDSITVIDSNGCQVTVNVTITEPVVLTTDIGITYNSCDSVCDIEAAATPFGGTPPYAYLWDDGQTTSTATGLCLGLHYVTVTDSNGCQVVDSVTIDSPPPLIAGIINTTDVLCNGDCNGTATATIAGGSPPYTYTWDGGSTPNDSSATGLCAGVLYTVILTDANGCDTSISSVTLSEPDPLNLSITDSYNPQCKEFCNGRATVTPAGGVPLYTYLWDDPLAQNDSTATGLCPGTYTVTVTDANGCTDAISHAVVATSSPPDADFIISPQLTTLLNSILFTNLSSPDVNSLTHYWDFGDDITDTVINAVHTYTSSGTYSVMLIVINSIGCSDTAIYTVTIVEDYILFAPNTFTPNRDGNNDVFIPKGIGIDENDFEMYIFNRWGDIIYETNDIKKPWDGRANAGRDIAQEDVYVWLVYLKDFSGERHQYVGHVTLIR